MTMTLEQRVEFIRAALTDAGRPDLAERVTVRLGQVGLWTRSTNDYKLAYRARVLAECMSGDAIKVMLCWRCGVALTPEQCSGVPGDAALRYETCGRWPDE